MKSEKATEPVIAVIDDDNSVRQSLARLLKASGFQSVLFGSAEAFLADSQHPWFDCLIVDLQLDGMSGVALRDRLRSDGVNTPIVLMTARDEREIDRQALQRHGATVIRKSDPGAALLEALRRVAHRSEHQQWNRRDGGDA